MDSLLEQSLLYDYYGELLTDRQKELYEQYVVEDLSLGEIAQMAGISRQAVHDQIRRVHKALQGYEDKLHLVERFLSIKTKLMEMETSLNQLSILTGTFAEDREHVHIHRYIEEVRMKSKEIIEEL